MANYNRAQYIKSSIESVIKQTSDCWELIIIDDASTDGAATIIQEYLYNDKIKLIQCTKHLGIVAARNMAIASAASPIIGIIDSDDVLDVNAVAVMLDAHKKYPHGLIYSQMMICDSNLKYQHVGSNKQIISVGGNLIENCISHFITFKKSFFDKIGGYDIFFNRCSEDKDLFYRMEEITDVLFIDQILYYYRINPCSVSNFGINYHAGRILHFIAKYRAYRRRLKNKSLKKVTMRELFISKNKV